MEASLNTWTSIFLLAAAQGVFLSILIISSKEKRSLTSGLLSIIVFFFSLILIYCVGYWTGLNKSLPPVVNLTISLTYLIGPAMLFFVKSVSKKATLSNNYFLHITPFIAHASLQLIALYKLVEMDTQFLIEIIIVLQNIHLAIYTLLILKNALSTNKVWLKHIAWAYAAYALCFMGYYIMSWTGILKIEYDYIVSLGMSAFIYFVGYYGYHHQIQPFINLQKYRNSGVSDAVAEQLYNKLNEYIIKDRPYLNHDLKLTDLADKLSLSTHIVSQIINQYTNGSFSDYINKLRIEEAIKLMNSEDYRNEKIISIAYDSGFSNKVSFNSAFKKITSYTPTAYRKMNCTPANMSIAS